MEHKSDYLILLAGANPLPNYISALSLNKENSKVYLLFTKNENGFIGTERLAQNIKDIAENQSKAIKVNLTVCDKCHGKYINSTMENVFKEIVLETGNRSGVKVHLNYTGGTKAMAALTYTYLKEKEAEGDYNFNYSYSYIDSEINKLIFEEDGSQDKNDLNSLSGEVNPKIEDICRLHGYEIMQKKSLFNETITEVLSEVRIRDNATKDIIYDFEYVFLKDFQICAVRKSNFTKKDKCKMELFTLKENANKIFGDQTRLCLISDIEDKETLKYEVNDFLKIENNKNIIILGSEENIVEYISNWI